MYGILTGKTPHFGDGTLVRKAVLQKQNLRSKMLKIYTIIIIVLTFFPVFSNKQDSKQNIRKPQIMEKISRIWIGKDFWANRLQDWRLRNGRVECVCPYTGIHHHLRTLHVVTSELIAKNAGFTISFRTGIRREGEFREGKSFTGVLIGAGAGKLDYRASSLIHCLPGQGGGIICALNDTGGIQFLSNSENNIDSLYQYIDDQKPDRRLGIEFDPYKVYTLTLTGAPQGGGAYSLTFSVWHPEKKEPVSSVVLDNITAESLAGTIALVSHGGARGFAANYWYKNLELSGADISYHPEREFSPIVNSLYSISETTVKMTVQFPPLGFNDSREVILNVDPENRNNKKKEYKSLISEPSYTAKFRIENWKSKKPVRYTLQYIYFGELSTLSGVLKNDPVKKDSIIIAAFTGNMNCGKPPDASSGEEAYGTKGRWTADNIWFPHSSMISHVVSQQPDLLVYTGDQIYEGGNPTYKTVGRNNTIDYLYKWFIWCWAHREITANIPSIVLMDDHDYWQGNIFGEGGVLNYISNHDSGGFTTDPEFVKMIEETQVSHNPDPYDPAPIENGIPVYYGGFKYGGVSFAFIEDRKFKSSSRMARRILEARGFTINTLKDLAPLQPDDAVLLGDRQIAFLEKWVKDWANADMKVVLTQGIFNSLITDNNGEMGLSIDQGGWPVSGRNRALSVFRKGCAFIIGGDQHLGSVQQYGINGWGDAGYQFSVPAVASKFRRWWDPAEPGKNRLPGSPEYTGDFTDKHGNKMTVKAVANPKLGAMDVYQKSMEKNGRKNFHNFADRELGADGYGIVRLIKPDRKIVIEAWPWESGKKENPEQFKDWPVSISMYDNYGSNVSHGLPRIISKGIKNPVITVIDENTNETVLAVRTNGNSFEPRVHSPGKYTVIVGEHGKKTKCFKGLTSQKGKTDQELKAIF
ncbi:MAG: hypothetical protein A2487_20250 [Candidatus Raymondbacteria bacterium RifOxyC12_full_50_8]|uniref:Uncharacterized protein n=1 Tax=Candidatus Raymondbacteria bacterium RIFOXYD12_FULL_49_13 TaxID=1817890 RepID=A0A1F7FKY9_UNCRA|nr:MAG: hypothetical protein A2248_11135 [Candidatus Raymondbacteria bacterium RIFOXYA2_FULL_49_16]OGJ95363.1 MAG: hypothetical protein A2453_09265 [Candidatus Raymondbacteria bacterium RIFOXYC2_FULL_50_21]OGK01897.1 MAG: hypothetical protein A2350_08825 [Candidatus Raymondbacteria bacterium RifOxyB12_full_50_8]OGK07112.1 MAG: hypothetical protein A2487_20250 [Candidatus Raymondbacteria bacterium RifOxyC12_full_50_8]OGK07379.1 MAG: hypothetical protein A2519_21160 [Candidatus Raymondbacteria ba